LGLRSFGRQIGDFRADHPYLSRRFNSDPDRLAPHVQNGDDDVFADLNLLVHFPCQHEHLSHSFAWFASFLLRPEIKHGVCRNGCGRNIGEKALIGLDLRRNHPS